MPIILTPSQQRTLDLDSHLSVTANAGAGKTTVLARRFVEIFARTDAPLTGVVAVTFTEQAAAELRKKVHDVILGIENDPSADQHVRSRLREIRNQLPSAVIGTIHSFCARILRMYPTEADIDASFSVLQGQERSRLVTESISGAFSDSLGGETDTDEATDFRELARLVPPARIESFLHSMFARREQMYRLLRTPECLEVISGGNIQAWSGKIIMGLVKRADAADWTGRAARMAAAATGSARDLVTGLLAELSECDDPETRARLIGDASEAMLTIKGGLRKKFTGPDFQTAEFPGDEEFLGDFHRRFGEVFRSFTGDRAAADTGPHARAISSLLRVFVRAQDGYGRRKDELGMLDFEDLQIRTLELLDNTEILGRIRAEYRFFLVDEFQDTNELQYSIVKKLLGDYRLGNIFIVGDPKQSIYGFRNADAGVFAEAATAISSLAENGSASGAGSLILAESFRPLSEIAAFVNFLFSRLMGGGDGPEEVEYVPLIVGREASGLEGMVEIVLPGDARSEENGAPTEECLLIARRIRALVSPGEGGGYRFGQCAVLLRDRRNLPTIEKAFEQEGVPYLLSGGVGYFQTQEIFDFLNYLAFLLSAGDDPALAGILRSPFYGISDAELYEVALLRGVSLWEKFSAAANAPAAPVSFRRARALLSAHRSLADRIPVPRLLRRIARDTGWLGTMAGLSHGPQRRENFLKLLELARERDVSGPVSLWDFREFLDHHAAAEEREAQAATTTGSDAVKVMTIHSAKGLEFPVVCIPFLDRKFRGDSEPFLDPERGVGFSVADLAGGKPRPGPIMPFLRAVSNEKRVAEEKRIFYVACTRARDVLILSGRNTPAGSTAVTATSPMQWLTSVLPAGAAPAVSGRISLGESTIECLSVRDGAVSTISREVDLSVMVRVGEGSSEAAVASAPPPIRPGRDRLLTEPVPDLSGGETYSATQIKSYLECPAKYYLTYVVGIGSVPGRSHDLSGGDHTADRDDEREMAGLEGVLTHGILSGISKETTPEDLPDRVTDLLLSSPGRVERTGGDLSDRVISNVSAFMASDNGKRILARPGAKSEFGIFASFDDAVLTGILDRVYPGEDGRMEFVDYKTDNIREDEIEARVEVYRPQMAMYALLVQSLYRQNDVTGRLIFLKCNCREVAFDFTASALADFSVRVRSAIEGIRMRAFTPLEVPCNGCPYREGRKCRVAPGLV